MICANIAGDYRAGSWNMYVRGFYTPEVNSISSISIDQIGSGDKSQSFSTPSMIGTITTGWASGNMTVKARISGKFAYSPNWTVVNVNAGDTICTGFNCVYFLG